MNKDHNDITTATSATTAIATATVGLNRKIKNKDKTNFWLVTQPGSFVPTRVSAVELAQHIQKGYAWMPSLLKPNTARGKKNVQCTHCIALDIDEGLSLAQAQTNELIRDYASLIITSASHSPEKHKYRVIFFLREAISEIASIEAVVRAAMRAVPQADKACKNADRFFYGADTAQVAYINEKAFLPASVIDEWLRREAEELEKAQQEKKLAEQRAREYRSSIASEYDAETLVEEMLSYIPPRVAGTGTYDMYVSIIAGLVNDYGVVQAERFLTLWDAGRGDWSPSTLSAKIQSFKQSGSGKIATLGSLWYYASLYGWCPPKRKIQKTQKNQTTGDRNSETTSQQTTRLAQIKAENAFAMDIGDNKIAVTSMEEAVQYITNDFDPANKKAYLLKAPMGTGKSQVALGLQQRLGLPLWSFATTRALSNEQAGKYNLFNYQDGIGSWQNTGDTAGGIVTSLDSAWKLKKALNQDLSNKRLMLVDEVDSAIHHINTAKTALASNRGFVRRLFIEFVTTTLDNQGLFLGMSADISKAEVTFFESFGIEVQVIEVAIAPYPGEFQVFEKADAIIGHLAHTFEEKVKAWKAMGKPVDSKLVPFATVISDSRRATDSVGVTLTGKYACKEEEDLVYWATLKSAIAASIQDIAGDVEVIIINAHTVGKKSVREFLLDIAGGIARNAALGKATIIIMSPTVREGVSIVHPGPHYSYVLMHGVLEVRSTLQMIKRDRNPERTFVWFAPQSNRAKPQTMAEMQTALAHSLKEFSDSDFVDSIKQKGALRLMAGVYFKKTGKYMSEANRADLTDFFKQALFEGLLTEHDEIDPQIVTDAFAAWRKGCPWLDYHLVRKQHDAITGVNYEINVCEGLINNGFTWLKDVRDDDAKVFEDMPVIDYKEAKSDTQKVDARWLLKGFDMAPQYQSESHIREVLKDNQDMPQQEYYNLQGALFAYLYPEVVLNEDLASKIIKEKGFLGKYRRLWDLLNYPKYKARLANQVSGKITDKGACVFDLDVDKFNIINVAKKLNLLDYVGVTLNLKDPLIRKLIAKCDRMEDEIKAINVKKPKSAKDALRFLTWLFKKFGIESKQHKRTVIDGHRVNVVSFEIPAVGLALLQAITKYNDLAEKTAEEHTQVVLKAKAEAIAEHQETLHQAKATEQLVEQLQPKPLEADVVVQMPPSDLFGLVAKCRNFWLSDPKIEGHSYNVDILPVNGEYVLKSLAKDTWQANATNETRSVVKDFTTLVKKLYEFAKDIALPVIQGFNGEQWETVWLT